MPLVKTKARSESEAPIEKKGHAVLEELVQKASRGDRRALHELCEAIAGSVLFRTTCILNNRTDAEDVSQEAMLRVCEKIQDLRKPETFKVWLGRIIANEAKRYYSKNAKHGVVLSIDDYLEAIMEDRNDILPQEYAESEESRKAVMEIIATLPLRQREAVLFHYYDSMSVTEVAEVMGVTKANVSQCLALAREKIKHELEKKSLANENALFMSVLPMGAILAGVLEHEAASLAPVNQVWLQNTLAKCSTYISSNPVDITAASKHAFEWMMGAVGTVITVTSMLLGISLGGTPQAEILQAGDVTIAGQIVFSGGMENNGTSVYVNPSHAEPLADSTGGAVEVLHWWITPAEDDAILYEGEGDALDAVLIRMQEDGMAGKYMLFFRLEDEAGAVHRLGRSFYIMTIQA